MQTLPTISPKNRIAAEKIAEQARNSISSICINDCKAYCCRKGFLVLNEAEKDVVTQNRAPELEQKAVLTKIGDGKYSLNLAGIGHQMSIPGVSKPGASSQGTSSPEASTEESCPSLKDNKCTIYTHAKRPLACAQFPIFIHSDTIRMSPRCLAVKMNVFYPYEKQWIKLGFKLDKGDSLFDSDFYLRV